MLPSRGVVRTRQAVRLSQIVRTACSRNFSTAGLLRRAPRAPAVSALASSRIFIGQLCGRRVGLVAPAVYRPNHPQNIPAASAAFSLSSLNPASWWSKKGPSPDASSAAAATTTPESISTETVASTVPSTPEIFTSQGETLISDPATSSDTASTLSEILDGSTLLDMPEQIGYLHAMGLDFGWGPTSMCQWALEHVHIYTGLPWWASIVAVTLLFRGAILLPSLTAAEQSAKFQVLRQDPKFVAMTDELKASITVSSSEAKRARLQELRLQMKRMQRAAGVQQWKMFIPMVNVPFGYGMFRLIRAMCALPVPGMESAGLLWFMDLTMPDPYFILPIVSAGTMYLIFRSNLKYMAPEQQQMMKMMQIVITPVSLLVTANMSSAMTFFFAIGAFVQAFQTWLWHQPWLRNWAGMPPLARLMNPGATAASRAASAAFRLAPGSSWQAPRTVAAPVSATAKHDVPSTVDVIKKGWSKAMGSAKDKQGASAKKQTLSQAEEYEKKRALEEEENLYRRREAERQYREMKRAMARAEREEQQK